MGPWVPVPADHSTGSLGDCPRGQGRTTGESGNPLLTAGGRSRHHGAEEVQQSRRGPIRGLIQFWQSPRRSTSVVTIANPKCLLKYSKILECLLGPSEQLVF